MNQNPITRGTLALTAGALTALALSTVGAVASGEPAPSRVGTSLETGFSNPPDSARAHCYWIWMNGNITREGITADLEAMAKGGIGGGLIFNLGGDVHKCDTPAGPVDYLGPQWLELMKHAASEAGRLGLELGMQNCAGWATTGGPWITPELAMQKLVSAEVIIEGGRRIEEKLPQPEVILGHYRDIAVFAIPAALDGGFRVDQWPSKAGQRGGRNGRQPDLKPLPKDAAIPLASILNVTGRLRADGTLAWEAPAGRWKLVRLGHTPTGTKNVPAPESATGLEIDKLRREGMDLHWKHGIQPVLDHLGPLVGKGFKRLLIDSYEAGLHHWTPRLREEFQERRGYDPTPYLLALTGRAVGDGPTTDRFLWDIRRTISDLFADNYYGYFADRCHQHGLEFTTEPYTSCFEGLQVGAKADIPMAEFWANGGYSFSMRLAASLAHIHGRPIAAAEAFTAGPPLGRWLDHPASLRRVGDLAWTEGINRFVLHSYAHQPWMDRLPGMAMGQYGCHFSRNSTWWKPGGAWLKYIARSQFLLQSGAFSADVLCFAGNAAPNGAVKRDDVKDAGYDYDGCGTDMLAQLQVKDGAVVLPSGKRYRLLVLPNHPFHTPAFARKLRELVREGATVIGPKPLHTPSLEHFPASEEEVRAIGEEVWGTCDGKAATSNRFGKGAVFWGLSPAEVLAKLNIKPAVHVPASGTKLAWLQRRTKDADIFFVSNQSNATVRTVIGFRAAGRQPELWDAEQGTIRPAAGWTVDGEHVRVPLELSGEKSIFVVFRDNGRSAAESSASADASVQKKAIVETLTLSGPWTVRFQKNRGAPDEATFDKLISWSEHTDPGIRYFSGTATTSKRFDLPEGFLANGQEVWLDLGDVAVIADVRLNGKDLGVLWHPPFRVEISKALRAGSNTLEVEVSNLWVNRLIGDEQLPADCEWTEQHLTCWPDWLASSKSRPQPSRVTFTTWKHWTANDPLLPSGLLGPVQLLSTACQANPRQQATDLPDWRFALNPDDASLARQPYPALNGGAFTGPGVKASPDPLSGYRWKEPKADDDLQVYALRPVAVATEAKASFVNGEAMILGNGVMTVKGTGSLRFDFGVESAAWLEFDSPDLAGNVEMSISEYDEPAVVNRGPAHPIKTASPVKQGNTYRLELNKALYEGVRFGWLHVRSCEAAWHITDIRLVCQTKPANYNGSFSCSDDLLTQIWYVGAYSVKLNLLKDYFGAILMDRGDRISWTGDAHPSQAAALVAFGNYDFIKKNIENTSKKSNGIRSYSLYWVLSLLDYYNYTGDTQTLMSYIDNACGKLDDAFRVYGTNPPLRFYGWDERLGAGFEHSGCTESQQAYRMLSIRAWNAFAGAMKTCGRLDLHDKYASYASGKMAALRQEAAWYQHFGLHAHADAVTTGLLQDTEKQAIFEKSFTDRVNRVSFSPFNHYFVLQAFALMNKYDDALSSVRDLWGGQIKYGGTTSFETYRPSWNAVLGKNAALPNNQCGYTSLCHPWGSGVTKWLSEEILGIKPTSPGFKTFDVLPRLGRTLTRVTGSTPTPCGEIHASFNVSSGVCSVRVPAGTVGRVGIPKAERRIERIRVNGQQAWDGAFRPVSGLGGASQDSEFVYFTELQPGAYTFDVAYGGATPAYVEPPASFPAHFAGEDATTRGNWGGVYGKEGYVLCNYAGDGSDKTVLPAYISSVKYFMHGKGKPNSRVWASGTQEARALAPDSGNGTSRTAAGLYTGDPSACQQSFTVTIHVNGRHHYQVALYFADWDDKGRRQAVEMFDETTLRLIAPTKIVKDFRGGKYLVYSYDMSARFRIYQIRGDNAVLSGIFFDPRNSTEPPMVSNQ